MKRSAVAVLVMALFLGVIGFVSAQEKQPDATLTLTSGQVAAGIGWNWGGGVLTYKGKEYPFKIKGLSVIDVGITKATASGKVYRLDSLEKFNGNYSGGSAEGTVGGGAGVSRIQNQNGVIIELVATTKGVNLKFAPQGIEFTLEK